MLRKKIDVHRAQSALLHRVARPPQSQLKRLVRADVRVRTWKHLRQFAEPSRNLRHSSRVARRQHRSMRRFAQRRILLEFENVVQVAERLLLGNHGDVILRGIRNQFARLFRRHRSARERPPPACWRRQTCARSTAKKY